MGRLFWKIFLWFWASTVLMVLITAWLIARLLDDPRFDDGREMAIGSAGVEMIASALEQGGEPFARRMIRRMRGQGGRTLVLDEGGRELLGRRLPPGVREQLSQSPTFAGVRSVETPDGRRYRVVPSPPPRHRMDHPQTPILGPVYRQLIGRAPRAAALRFGVTVALSGLFCFALAWYLSRPAVRLRQATSRVTEGDLTVRVAPEIGGRWDEFGDLGREFDTMVERIQGLLDGQRRLLGDVSHEIRSPLARMRLAVELLRRNSDGDAEAKMQRIEREVERLDELVGGILTLSRLESGSGDYPTERIDLATLLEEVVGDARFEAKERALSLILHQRPAVRGNPQLLRSAMENLVRNAIRHTPNEGAITVELWCDSEASKAVIRIEDEGEGVSPELLSKLFEPFVRGETASGGFGLGLAITRRGVEAHAGRVWAENCYSRGLRVMVELPL